MTRQFNAMGLRVAALNLCSHPKRYAELRDAPVRLPDKWQNSELDYVLQLAAAATGAEQVALVKQIFKLQPEAVAFLADVLFASPLKHVVRNQLIKCFSKNSASIQPALDRDALIAALRQSLRALVAQLAANSDDDESFNDVLVSICACLQTFPYGRDALALEIHLLVPLLPGALRRYWAAVCLPAAEQSPTKRNEYYLFIQNLLRFHVNFLVELKVELVPSDCEELRDISTLAEIVAKYEDTPWDVRSIAGLAIGQNARFFKQMDGYIASCHAMREAEELTIQSAALLVLQKTDYEQYATEALGILQRIIMQTTRSKLNSRLVYMSKHLFIYSKSLGQVQVSGRSLVMYKLILASLLGFSLQHIGCGTDSVRHMCADMLRQVLLHALAVGQEMIFKKIFEHFEDRRCSLNSGCLMLEQIVAVCGVQPVLENCPSLFGTIFKIYLGREDSVDALYKCMMTTARLSQRFDEWHKLWGVTLIEVASLRDERLHPIERLIIEAVTLMPSELSELLNNQQLPFSSKLAAMATVRRAGKRDDFHALLAKFEQSIYDSIIGLDDHTRLLALRFVVVTPKVSEPLSRCELEAIANYIYYNANNTSAHLRQLGYALLLKALKRIELTLAPGLKQLPKDPKALEEHYHLHKYLRSLMATMVLNLFPTANYGRRWLSLRLLRDCVNVCVRLKLPMRDMVPAPALPFLEDCLGDSYEHNKQLAAVLLKQLNDFEVPTVDTRARLKPAYIMQLLVSLRPPDSATGAFQLEYYCQRYNNPKLPLEFGLAADVKLPRFETARYAGLQWCLAELKNGLALAQRDLSQAAKFNPLYGLLHASRHFLQQLKLANAAKELLWREYIAELVTICMAISEVVLPVLSCDSPEGYLPTPNEELTEVEQPVNVLRSRLSSSALAQLPTTPQMVLLCAWRSSKEVSLILGLMVNQAPLQNENDASYAYLLDHTQLAAIAAHFQMLLAETKHRGAFEQAYVGFTLLCKRFWSADSPRLHNQPAAWLKETLDLVCLGGDDLCATRRSAGVPYMLQSLICTELQLGTHSSFRSTISQLLKLCDDKGKEKAVSRTHALNIMRALFRCSELSDLVGEFISPGLICALESYVADDWMEQNSATLLFAALLVRIFGVERARSNAGELHLRNRMTGRIFFTRYPEIFDYFHNALKAAAKSISEGEQPHGQSLQLEALLLLLCRLYPSSMEGSESSLNLAVFVPFLMQICRSHDLMTRERAALVLANFVEPAKGIELMRQLLFQICLLQGAVAKKGSGRLDMNSLHGQLLMLLQLYRRIRWQDSKLIRLLIQGLVVVAEGLYKIDILIFNAVLNILTFIMLDCVNELQLEESLIKCLYRIYRLDHKFIYDSCASYAISPKLFQLFGLHLHRQLHNTNAVVEHMLATFVEPVSVPMDIQELKVQVWLYMLFHHKDITHGLFEEMDIEEYKFENYVVRYVQALQPKARQELVQTLHKSTAVHSNLMDMANNAHNWHPKLLCKLYALLAMLRTFTLTMEQLMALAAAAGDGGHEMLPGLTIGVTRLVMHQGVEQAMWLPVLRYALNISGSHQTLHLRYKAAQLSDRLTLCARQQFCVGDVEIIGHYILLIVQLLVDESCEVRNFTAEMVASCISVSGINELPLNVDRIFQSPAKILPTAALAYFLRHSLSALQKFRHNSNFLLRLYNIIVEPFLASALSRQQRNEAIPTSIEDFEVFDRHETNIYCESLNVISEVADSFKTSFPSSKELRQAFQALDNFCAYEGYGAQPIRPNLF